MEMISSDAPGRNVSSLRRILIVARVRNAPNTINGTSESKQMQPSRLSSLRRSDHARLRCVTHPSASPTDNRFGRSFLRKDDAAPR
jgi:hypothetical protein